MAQALIRIVLVALVAAALTGCSGAVRWNEPETRRTPAVKAPARSRVPRTGVHVVKSGESLYAIALRYRLDARDIARWNQLGNGELIFPGQRLRLTGPPAPATSASAPSPQRSGTGASAPPPAARPKFVWPAVGKVQRPVGEEVGAAEGVNILADVGTQVVAAAEGRVVYSGSGLIGYGNLIIVKHGARYLTAYGYNDALLVKEGDSVRQGQPIARMGRGPDRVAALHFEIRLDGKPVDPLRYLDRSRALSPE